MTRFFFAISITLLLALGQSCQKFKTNFEMIAYRCGVEANTIDPDQRTFQLLLESGEIPTASFLSSLQARFVDHQSSKVTLTISPGACLFVSRQGGLVQVFSPDSGLHVSAEIEENQDRSIQLLLLKKKTNFDIDLRCPREGLFSQGQLLSPLQINSLGSLESIDLQLKAVSTASGLETILVNKPYGIVELPRVANVLPQNMLEGAYELRLSYSSSMEEWDREFKSQPDRSNCLLMLQKQPPVVKGLSLNLGQETQLLTLKNGDSLPWFAESPIRNELRFCKEKVASDEDEFHPNETECNAKNRCLDKNIFTTLNQKRADENGIFHYFLYAEDAASNLTSTYCERVTVSGSSPRLTLSWKNPAWNIPLSVMDSAAIDVEAEASVTHPYLLDAKLKAQLQCKIEFKFAGQVIIPGRDVLCTGSFCKGENLAEYQTCGEQIRFSLSRFWKNQKAQRLEMQLHVRSIDTNGLMDEAMTSVWIYPERFQPQLMTAIGESADDIFESNDREIFLRKGLSLVQWNEQNQSWNKSDLPTSSDTTRLKVIKGKTGEIYAYWESPSKFEAAEWTEKSWKILPPNSNLNSCHFEMEAHPIRGFWCQKFDDVLLWQGDQWKNAGLPKGCRILSNNKLTKSVAINSQGQMHVSCADGRLLKEESSGVWTSQPVPFENPSSIAFDKLGRLWAFFIVKTGGDRVAYLDDQQWHTVTDRPPNLDPRRYGFFVGGSEGEVYYNDSRWDLTKQAWIRPPEIETSFPDVLTIRSYQGPWRFLWTEAGLAAQSRNQANFFPLASFGILADEMKQPLLDSKGRLWFVSQLDAGKRFLYRTSLVSWQTYAEEAGITPGQQNSYLDLIGLNKESGPEFFYSHRGTMKAGAYDWQNIFPVQTPTGGVFASYFVDGHSNYYAHDYRKLYAVKGAKQFSLLGEFSNTVSVFDGFDYYGRSWIHISKTRELWIVDREQLTLTLLPESFDPAIGMPHFYFLRDRILAISDGKIYRWNEESRVWDETDRFKERLPFKPKVMKRASPDHLVIQLAEDSNLRLFDNIVDRESTIPLPPADPLRGEFKLTDQGLYFLSSDQGLFLYKDGLWLTLLGRETVQKRLTLPGTFYFEDFLIDKYQRIWISGGPFRLLRLDIGKETG